MDISWMICIHSNIDLYSRKEQKKISIKYEWAKNA